MHYAGEDNNYWARGYIPGGNFRISLRRFGSVWRTWIERSSLLPDDGHISYWSGVSDDTHPGALYCWTSTKDGPASESTADLERQIVRDRNRLLFRKSLHPGCQRGETVRSYHPVGGGGIPGWLVSSSNLGIFRETLNYLSGSGICLLAGRVG